ncbi:MAG: PDZ domain-containing protein [Alishewanella sp.]|nr:PDZ domain-containing protein [Alishewanella sp.]
MSAVQYEITFDDISAHLLTLSLHFEPSSAVHHLTLPAWIPGSYLVRNFARHIVNIRAYDADGELHLAQRDKQSWQLSCGQQPVTVTYQVYANDLSVRAAYVDDELAVLNPACLCLNVSEMTAQPHSLTLHKPTDLRCAAWRVATAMPKATHTAPLDFGCYQADNYDHLIDSPLLVGIFNVQQFNLDGVPHYVVVSGHNLYDEARLTADVAKLCQVQRDVFGELPRDLDQYWFLLWVTEQGYGGLEHKFSTLLLCNRYDLPAVQQTELTEAYQNLLGLFSHEYFHTWWVKRLKPQCFTPYVLDKEQYSRQLWLYEGFTSYFDDLALVKSGIIEQSRYLTVLEKLITRVSRNPSDSQQSLTDSSFTAWTKFYLQDENAVNSVVSYYAKGALVALLLEAELQSKGLNLAAFCRQLYQQHVATGTSDNAIFEQLIAWQLPELAAQLTSWINEAKPLPLAATLGKLGLTLTQRAPSSFSDLAGESSKVLPASLGCSLKTTAQGVFIQQLYRGSAAHQAGLMSGDQLVALGGYKISETSLTELMLRLPLGSVQPLFIFRKDRLLELALPIQQAAPAVAMLNVANEVTVKHWLSS